MSYLEFSFAADSIVDGRNSNIIEFSVNIDDAFVYFTVGVENAVVDNHDKICSASLNEMQMKQLIRLLECGLDSVKEWDRNRD